MLREFELGDEALTFIRSQLALGRGLAGRLLSVSLERGRAVTHLPPTVETGDLLDFESGGVASGEETPYLAELIGERLARRGERSICVFEHAYARREDPGLERSQLRHFTVEEDVYLFVDPGDLTEDITQTAREAHLYPSVGIVGALPDGHPRPDDRSEQEPALLDVLCTSADSVIIGAYDAEAWLVWTVLDRGPKDQTI